MIDVEEVGRSFGDKHAVRELSLHIAAGEIFGFLGPNGAGKTTTIRMLCGLLQPSRGSIRIGGRDRRRDAEACRRLIGFVPDSPPLYEYLTVVEYIGFVASLYRLPREQRDQRAAVHLAALGLQGQAADLCRSLSHGTRKKVHLAAMLTVAPPVLILDEPTNGLDPPSARAFKDVMLRVRDAGTTVFLSTHVLDVAEELCDRIGILHHGRLLACGTLAELRARGGTQRLEDLFLLLTHGDEAHAGDAAR